MRLPMSATEGSAIHPSHGGTVAVSLFGALGGASILETVASAFATHPLASSIRAQPVAGPLAVVGALIGCAVTLIIWRRLAEYDAARASVPPDALERGLGGEVAPLSPMAWQPVPRAPLHWEPPAPLVPRPARDQYPAPPRAVQCVRARHPSARPASHRARAPRRLTAQG